METKEHKNLMRRYFDSDSMRFFTKLLTKKEHENIQVQLAVPEIFSKMLNKVNGVS